MLILMCLSTSHREPKSSFQEELKKHCVHPAWTNRQCYIFMSMKKHVQGNVRAAKALKHILQG